MIVTVGKPLYHFIQFRWPQEEQATIVFKNKDNVETILYSVRRIGDGTEFCVPATYIITENLPATATFKIGTRVLETISLQEKIDANTTQDARLDQLDNQVTNLPSQYIGLPNSGTDDYAVPTKLSGATNNLSWTTNKELVARSLGWAIVTDPRYAGGAKGDGTTNDTSAIQAALDTGNTVWFPPGTYLVNSSGTSVLTGHSNQIINGSGANLSIIKLDSASSTATRLLNLSGKTNVSISGLAFDGQSNATAKSGIFASTSGTQKNITVANCKFLNWMPSDNTSTAGAIYVWTADGVHVIDNEFVGCGRAINIDQPDGHVNILRNRITAPVDNVMCTGIYVRRSSGSSESKVLIDGNYIQGANRDTADTGAEGHGISVYRVRDVQIKNNHSTGNGRGILVSNQSFGASIIGNHCTYNQDAGIRCEPEIAATSTTVGTAGVVRGVTVIGNVCRNNVSSNPRAGYYGQGIAISYAAGSVVSNNVVANNGSNGIFTDSDRVSITGNIVYNNNQNYTPTISPAVRSGIRMYSNTGCTVTGNQCFDNQTTKTQDYGLALGSGGHVVSNNNFDGNAISGVYNNQSIIPTGQLYFPRETLDGPTTSDITSVATGAAADGTLNESYVIASNTLPTPWPVDVYGPSVITNNTYIVKTSVSSVATVATYRIMTDAPKISLFVSATNFMADLFIDGKPYASNPITLTATTGYGAYGFQTITFPSAKPRLVEWRSVGGLVGVYVAKPYRAWRPAPEPNPRIAVVGDSYVLPTTMNDASAGQVTVGNYLRGAYQRMTTLLGTTSLVTDGIGGTGYLAGGGSNLPYTHSSRISWLTTANPDVIIVHGGGCNDLYNSFTVNQTIAAANSYFQTLRTNFPKARLVFVEGFSPPVFTPATYNPNYIAIRQGVQAAVGISNMYYLDIATTRPPLTGSGYVTATNSTGNSDIYVGSDGAHPTIKGHEYIRNILAGKIRRVLADDGRLDGTLVL